MNDTSPGYGCRALLMSVGGSPEPVAYALDAHRPECVLMFASRASRSEVEAAVRPLARHRWRDQEIITTPDHENLEACMALLAERLPRVLRDLGLKYEDLIVDYTGGTKTMSAALVLATINRPVRYSYVGGAERSKEGLGVVVSGSERVLRQPNPWEVLAVDLYRRLAGAFNGARFAEARDTAARAAAHVGEARRGLYVALRDVCDAYGRWEAFDYAGAVGPLRGAVARLLPYVESAGGPSLTRFQAEVAADCERLERIRAAVQSLQRGVQPGREPVREAVLDLLANAWRTHRLAGRSDDAVARLYSALEKLSKAALAERGIDNSAASPEQIPAELREEFLSRYGDGRGGELRFGLDASYRLLRALGDPLGERYAGAEDRLSAALGARNASLMAHGWQPVSGALFEQLYQVCLEFLDIGAGEVPVLPRLPEP